MVTYRNPKSRIMIPALLNFLRVIDVQVTGSRENFHPSIPCSCTCRSFPRNEEGNHE